MTKPIAPETAKAFVAELNDLLDKYGFAFSCMQWIYQKYEGQTKLFANTELLEKLADNPKYNRSFTVHYERDEIIDKLTQEITDVDD